MNLVPGCYSDAPRNTQTRDMGHSVALLLEKDLDNFGRAGVAHGDIARYFDSLLVLRILKWLLGIGVAM